MAKNVLITYFKDKNKNYKKIYKKFNTLTTILKSFDTFVIIATTSSSLTLSLTGVALIAIPTSTSTASGLSIKNKVIYEIILNKYNKYEEQNEKDQQTITSFDKLYRTPLEDKSIDIIEYEILCNFSTKFLKETKNELFL